MPGSFYSYILWFLFHHHALYLQFRQRQKLHPGLLQIWRHALGRSQLTRGEGGWWQSRLFGGHHHHVASGGCWNSRRFQANWRSLWCGNMCLKTKFSASRVMFESLFLPEFAQQEMSLPAAANTRQMTCCHLCPVWSRRQKLHIKLWNSLWDNIYLKMISHFPGLGLFRETFGWHHIDAALTVPPMWH